MVFSHALSAQENYEIQVYSSPTMDRGSTMFELHSNYTFNGERKANDGVYPSYHSLHETLEITHGIAENFEIGFYLFTNYTPGSGYKIVGTHIRPRVTAPQKWNWPLGVSLSTEFGYQRRQYSEETWNVEVRPIVDKQWKNFYVSFNPTFGISLKPDSTVHVPAFEPNLKLSYGFNKLALGLEYYGDLSYINAVPKLSEQSHALFVVADLYLDPRWEVNLGPGFGLTNSTDGFIFKLLIGRRINWKKAS
jgi:hypothetical protein